MARKALGRLHDVKAKLTSVSMELTNMAAVLKVTKTIQRSTAVMHRCVGAV